MLIIYTDSQIWASDVSEVFDWMLQVKGPAFSMLQNFVLGRVYIFLSDLLYFVLKADVYVKSCHNPKQIKDRGYVCLKTLCLFRRFCEEITPYFYNVKEIQILLG